MARIREDLVGCVYVGMTPYFGGDTVPDGVVHPVFLASDDTPADVVAVSASEVSYSEDAGNVSNVDTSEVETPPEQVGVAESVEAEGAETVEKVTEDAEQVETPPVELGEFDPNQASVRTVRDYLTANPQATERVLELERAGQARKSLIGE